MIIYKDTNLIHLMEDKHIPKVLLSNTVIVGVRFQHMNFGRTKTQVYLHSVPCSPLQKYPTLVTCTHPHIQSYARGYTDPVTYTHVHTHTAKPYFHTNTHWVLLTCKHPVLLDQTDPIYSVLPSASLILSHSFTHLTSLSPLQPTSTPKVKASSSGLFNHRSASPNNCFLICNCHFFLKKCYCSMVDCNVVLVLGVQQSESVTCICIGTFFQILFQYRLLQSTEQCYLCYTVPPC